MQLTHGKSIHFPFSCAGDEMFKIKALDLGHRLLPAFNTGTGIPHALVNLAKYVLAVSVS
jgi:hypothetical protein